MAKKTAKTTRSTSTSKPNGNGGQKSNGNGGQKKVTLTGKALEEFQAYQAQLKRAEEQKKLAAERAERRKKNEASRPKHSEAELKKILDDAEPLKSCIIWDPNHGLLRGIVIAKQNVYVTKGENKGQLKGVEVDVLLEKPVVDLNDPEGRESQEANCLPEQIVKFGAKVALPKTLKA